MLCGTVGVDRWLVLFRGSFHRRQDYTQGGSRLYRFGVALALAGFLLAVGGIALGG
jgi:hypothetical protein